MNIGKLISLLIIALFVVSCGESGVKPRVEDPETTPTQIAIDLISVESKNGEQSYRMQAPIMERYELAETPFTEFKNGIKVETFNDSTGRVASNLLADYARLDETTEIWEVRGNVVGRNVEDDKTLFTEQLYWDQKQDKIYTDKFVKVLDGGSIHRGTGFESDGGFKTWIFKTPRGKMEVDRSDSTAVADSTLAADSMLMN